MSKLQRGRTAPAAAAEERQARQPEEFIPEESLDNPSALQILDRVNAELATQGTAPSMLVLRRRIAEMEELQDEARAAVEKLTEAVEKLRAPALRLGTLMQKLANGRALVCAGGTEYICNVDPAIAEDTLETGTRVLLNEAFAVTDAFGFDKNGPVVRISELLSDGRLRNTN